MPLTFTVTFRAKRRKLGVISYGAPGQAELGPPRANCPGWHSRSQVLFAPRPSSIESCAVTNPVRAHLSVGKSLGQPDVAKHNPFERFPKPRRSHPDAPARTFSRTYINHHDQVSKDGDNPPRYGWPTITDDRGSLSRQFDSLDRMGNQKPGYLQNRRSGRHEYEFADGSSLHPDQPAPTGPFGPVPNGCDSVLGPPPPPPPPPLPRPPHLGFELRAKSGEFDVNRSMSGLV